MKKNFLNRWFGSNKAASEIVSKLKLRDGLTVLVVDDSRTQVFAISKMLKAAGVCTETAENGKQAIIKAMQIKPDLILMDIVMPEVNGFQATRHLTRQKTTAHIPIIMISGTEQESDKAWGLKLGAKDFLRKPVQQDLLLEKINFWTTMAGDEHAVVKKSAADFSDALAEAG